MIFRQSIKFAIDSLEEEIVAFRKEQEFLKAEAATGKIYIDEIQKYAELIGEVEREEGRLKVAKN